MSLNHGLVRRVERALRFSTAEGMAYGAVQGAGEHFTSAYATALGASNTQFGLLSSVPAFAGALAQPLSTRLVVLLGSRKRVVLAFVALNGFMWLPVLSVSYLLKDHQPVMWLIAFLTLYTVFNAPTNPVWGSIMAEVVPDRVRGGYFGLRSRWSTLANVLTFLLAGGLLYALRDHGFVGFAIVFAAAFAFRMVSLALLTTMVELPHSLRDDDHLTPLRFFRSLPSTNLGRAILYLFCVNFVVNLSGPFFVPYMLRDLQFNYLTFTALEVLTPLAAMWAVTHWGAAADHAGNRRMLALSGALIGVVPLLWIASGNAVYLGFCEAYAGFAWAGFNLVSVNFIYDATTARNRTFYLAYYSAGVGVASGLGALAGGFLIGHVPELRGSAILTMFLLSGLLRLLSAAVFLPSIREVRRTRAIPAAEVFHIMLGGRGVHRPASHGRTHHHLHSHREPP